MDVNKLDFHPFLGMGSRHLQMILSSLLLPGIAPPSEASVIDIGNGDSLSCEISTPLKWSPADRTLVLVHGLGGSHASNYMIRIARKFYLKGNKVVRVNLRGCGSGRGLSKLLYHAGTSGDILKVVEWLKKGTPDSEIMLMGFSLGGNIILKLAGELGTEAKNFVQKFIAICPPLDLAQTVNRIQEKRNRFYHSYYLKKIRDQAGLAPSSKIRTLYEFDDLITAPPWGYNGASEYYQACSSVRFLPQIHQSTYILLARDDPFICVDRIRVVSLPDVVRVWVTERGSHLGFLGKTSKERSSYNQELSFYWMDELLLRWAAQ